MRKAVILFVTLVLLATVSATPAYAQAPPALPHAFCGSVLINGDPAPDGTQVSATVETGEIISTQNPVATENGNYGIDGLHLLVQGYDLSGAITFYVNGVEAEGVTATFEAGGGPDEKNLSVTIEAPPVGPPARAAFSVSSLSIQPAEVEPGETVTIRVSVANTGGKSGSYTVVLKIDGVKEAEETVTIAAGSSRTVSFSVTREEAASYTVAVDGLSGSFTVAPVVVPPEPAAFSVSFLSVSPRLEVEPNEAVTITVFVANTGGESGSYTVVLKIGGVKEAEETVTVAAGESQDISFSVTREEAGIYAVAVDGLSGSFTVVAPEEEEEEEVPTKINWPLIGGIIGGVIVVGLGVFFWMRRRE